jgi:hypothetical protein
MCWNGGKGGLDYVWGVVCVCRERVGCTVLCGGQGNVLEWSKSMDHPGERGVRLCVCGFLWGCRDRPHTIMTRGSKQLASVACGAWFGSGSIYLSTR